MPIPWLTKILREKKIKYNGRNILANIVRNYTEIKSKGTYRRIRKQILGKKLLDIGVGAGGIYKYLEKKGFKVTGLDVNNFTVFEDVPVTVYDGTNFPFKDKEFDTALLIHVLHHCTDGLRVLDEAKRVSKRVIVIDDSYRNEVERAVVSMSDQIGNWEFYEHPYHTTKWWQEYIKSKGWKLAHIKEYSSLTYMLYARYLLFVIE